MQKFKDITFYAVQPEHCNGWWVVSTDEEGYDALDESRDGGYEKETAEYIAKCLNYCKDKEI